MMLCLFILTPEGLRRSKGRARIWRTGFTAAYGNRIKTDKKKPLVKTSQAAECYQRFFFFFLKATVATVTAQTITSIASIAIGAVIPVLGLT